MTGASTTLHPDIPSSLETGPMHPLHPDDPRRLGCYRLLRRIGEGGMGVVFLAVSDDGMDNDLVAVKAIRSEFARDQEFRARFTGEVDLARRVQGPYTARVLDADTHGPTPWLATEYVPGPALNDAVRGGGPFPEGSLLALAAGLAEALSAIHEVGLIHRDLKPSNVLLAPRGPQVIDFGIARATDATALTRTGQTLGTPAYMSPEQATGARLDSSSDLFSYGGVLLFAATGRPPFGTGDPAALLYRVVNEPPDLRGLPERLLPLVTACLAKNPDDRPALDSVSTALADTVLSGEDGDATEWLPPVIATTIQHTLVAATKALPTKTPSEQAASADAVSALPPPSPIPRDEEDAVPPTSTRRAPETNGEEAGARTQERATPPSRDLAQQTPTPTSAVPDPAQGEGKEADRSSTSTVFWGAVVVAVVSVVVLGTALNHAADPATRAGTDLEGRETGEATPSASPSPSSSPTGSPPRNILTEVDDIAFLGDPDRFAVLSSAGLDLFETERPEPIERLTEQSESFAFGRSDLASTPDGSVVAAKRLRSAGDGVAAIHVWRLGEPERSVFELPEEVGDGGHLALSPDGETLFLGHSGGEDSVLAFDVDSGQQLYGIDTPEDERGRVGFVHGVRTSPDGELLVAALSTGLAVWDAASGEPHPSYPEFREWRGELSRPTAFGDGLVATATWESLLLWDVRSDDEPKEFPLPRDATEASVRIREVSIGDGGNRIVAVGRNLDEDQSLLLVWNAEGEVLMEDRAERDYSLVASSPTDDRVLVAFHPLGQEGREEFVLLDGELETVQEFLVPGR